jgi:YgiT-type zinc finger domain-containing protein
MRRGEGMKCEFCGSETTKRKVKKQHCLEGKLYIVENVEAEVRRECGERYFHASTLDRIDKLVSGDHSVKEVLSVEVVSA